MNPHPFTDKALALRKKGKSYSEIETELEMSRSTLHYIFKRNGLQPNGSKLPSWIQDRMDERVDGSRDEFKKEVVPFVTNTTRRKYGVRLAKYHPDILFANLEKARRVVAEKERMATSGNAFVSRYQGTLLVTIDGNTERELKVVEAALSAAAQEIIRSGGTVRIRKPFASAPICEGMILMDDGVPYQRKLLVLAKRAAIAVLEAARYRIRGHYTLDQG
jgi:hypothetical protein